MVLLGESESESRSVVSDSLRPHGRELILVFLLATSPKKGFPDSSVGKESTCNAGDPRLIPGLGRSTGEGLGHTLQHSWASLVAQLVKNLPVMQETPVRFLGQDDPLEKGEATRSSTLGLYLWLSW